MSSALSKRNPNWPPRVHFARRPARSWPERIRQHAQRAQRRVHRIQIFDLVIEFALGGRVEFAWPLALNQDFQEEREEIEILLGGRQRKRIDFEILGFEADADIGAAEKLREAFKAPAQVEDERVRLVFLEIGDEEIQQETIFPAPVRPRIMVWATSR